MNYFLLTGIVLNALLILVNRLLFRLPNWIQIPLLLVGIGLIMAGIVMMR